MKVCFRKCSTVVNTPYEVEKTCILQLFEVLHKCQFSQVDYAVLAYCILTDFLHAWFINDWQFFQFFKHKSGYICFSFSSISFCITYLWCFIIKCIQTRDCYDFLGNWPSYPMHSNFFIINPLPYSEACFVWN